MTAAQLLALLAQGLKEERPRDWPRTPREVTSILRRYAPGLRQSGWTVEHDDGRNRGNTLRWTLVPPTADGEASGEDQGEDREDE
jgi:hypothetical protein